MTFSVTASERVLNQYSGWFLVTVYSTRKDHQILRRLNEKLSDRKTKNRQQVHSNLNNYTKIQSTQKSVGVGTFSDCRDQKVSEEEYVECSRTTFYLVYTVVPLFTRREKGRDPQTNYNSENKNKQFQFRR